MSPRPCQTRGPRQATNPWPTQPALVPPGSKNMANDHEGSPGTWETLPSPSSGITRVAQAIGLSRVTVRAGLKELDLPITPAAGRETLRRLHRVGGGQKDLVDHDVDLLHRLEILVDPVTRGDPMSPLQWTCKSAAKLVADSQARGHAVSERSVNRLLHTLDYSLQSNRKTPRRQGPPGPGCPIPVHQPAGQGVSATGTAGGVGRYQEEGIGRPVPHRR